MNMNIADDQAELFGILKTLHLLASRRAAHERSHDVQSHFAELWGELETAADDFAATLPAPTEH
ncbi:hypothetical protein HF680_15415 [Brevundimonas sp. WCHBH090558]|uniref:hypothetical protein n=1 Tax=Brevundimonas huaxiensis TaxID=2725493 RepID=UPI00162663DD|nr:hypothetical protein [Brevundimonas huaxiensis]MBC1184029.1 hypothetical protein [Brevundimonas huaxiensis]